MKFQPAPDIQERIKELVFALDLNYLDSERIICFRSFKSTSNARARIWSFPKIWQKALGVKAHYIIEVLSEKFDSEDMDEQTKILLHELLHIPRNFSGALVSHNTVQFDGKGGHIRKKINRRVVDKLFKLYKSQRI